MSRTVRSIATALMLGAAATAAAAQSNVVPSNHQVIQVPPRGQAQAAAASPTPAPAQAIQELRPATAEERATYDRLDPLARSVFWTREQAINPADPVAGARLAQALREMGQYEQAVEAAQRTLAVDPRNVDALLEVGRAHIARGQAFYGIASLEQARAVAPSDWRPLSLLGVAYQQVRRFDDARAAWNAGLALSPDNADILTNVAIAQMASGDAPGAEALLRRAAAQPNASMKVRMNLALALGLQNKTAEAENLIRRDLPPHVAEQNLAWLRQRTSGAATSAEAGAAASGRTWSSIQGG